MLPAPYLGPSKPCHGPHVAFYHVNFNTKLTVHYELNKCYENGQLFLKVKISLSVNKFCCCLNTSPLEPARYKYSSQQFRKANQIKPNQDKPRQAKPICEKNMEREITGLGGSSLDKWFISGVIGHKLYGSRLKGLSHEKFRKIFLTVWINLTRNIKWRNYCEKQLD